MAALRPALTAYRNARPQLDPIMAVMADALVVERVVGLGWQQQDAGRMVRSVVSVCCPYPVFGADRKKWNPRKVGEMLADPDLEVEVVWMVEGIAARGVVTLFAGHGKSGKTTFLTEMAASAAEGKSFLGHSTTKTKVLWLDLEQNEALTTAKFRALNPPKDLAVHIQNGTRQAFTIEELVGYIATEEIGMLIVDSLTKFWQLEDSASDVQVTREIGILMEISRMANMAVVVIHHTRKSGGGGEDLLDVAGSYAVLGTVDVAITFKRDPPNGDTARILKTIGRYGSGNLVVTFADGRYSAMGDPAALAAERLEQAVLDVVTDEPQDTAEIAKAAEKSRSRVADVLKAAFGRGAIQREGDGKRGNPYHYYREKSFLSGPNTSPGQKTESISGLEDRYTEHFQATGADMAQPLELIELGAPHDRA